MINNLQQQIIAALIAAPDNYTRRQMSRMEPADFPNPHYALIFETLAGLNFPNHPEPGSIMVQLNRVLLNGGHFRDQDDGLRTITHNLVGITGHPQQLPEFISDLLTYRWKQATIAYGENLMDHAEKSPNHDIVSALGGIEEIRRLYTRISVGEGR